MQLIVLLKRLTPISVKVFVKSVIKRWSQVTRAELKHACFSCSGWGEDRIVEGWLIMSGLRPDEVRYLDIGAAEPIRLSNTYLLYKNGARGVLVEPDPKQARALRRVRPRDTVLEVGVTDDGSRSGTLTRMTTGVFNTLSRNQADFVVESSKGWLPDQRQEIVDEITVPLMSINEVIDQHLSGIAPHFISIDVEGMDFGVLASLDFSKYKPLALCVERHASISEFEKILSVHGYRLIACTHDNAVFFRGVAI